MKKHEPVLGQRLGSLPLYQQICEMLIREIASGHMVDGERLPPEREMASSLGIAVGTLRKSLAVLEEKGLLERLQGSGNTIRSGAKSGAIAASIYSFFRLELIAGGGLPTADVLSVDLMQKPTGLPDFGSSPSAHRIRRVRSIGNKIAALEEIWLDASYAISITADDLSESLYQFYKNRLGLIIVGAEDRVSISNIPPWAPEQFPLSLGTASGFVERISYARDGAKAEYSRTWFDTQTAHYIARLQ